MSWCNCKIFIGKAKIATMVCVGVAVSFCIGAFLTSTANHSSFAQVESASLATALPPPSLSSSPLSQSVLIKSNTHWAGMIFDSNRDSTIRGSYGDASFDVDCSHGLDPYSAVFHKEGETGYLTISLVKNGEVLDTQTTTDSFGSVQMSGKCEMR